MLDVLAPSGLYLPDMYPIERNLYNLRSVVYLVNYRNVTLERFLERALVDRKSVV